MAEIAGFSNPAILSADIALSVVEARNFFLLAPMLLSAWDAGPRWIFFVFHAAQKTESRNGRNKKNKKN